MALTLAPVRDAAANGMLTGRPMNVLNVTTLDIPVATLKLLEKAFNQVSLSNILVHSLYFFLYHFSNFNNACHLD